jgi:hypothetical protein
LKAKAVSLKTETNEDYLQTSEVFPGDAWGEEYVYGYLTEIGDMIVFDEMIWIDDAEAQRVVIVDE